MAIDIVDLIHPLNMVIFHSYVYQRVLIVMNRTNMTNDECMVKSLTRWMVFERPAKDDFMDFPLLHFYFKCGEVDFCFGRGQHFKHIT